ncbi:hypothetical protein K2173_001324 [Erythroxylum novogranatense]|uniref:Reverse transcriptase Ty1/copia-type domain-containing protein n=1 Tax=Erythroxylum novogranatense TaxID=1862640 RepID=A0AAV8T4U2_9ROSI|nr:hypothetical protein K2173_001324 [Erythroxylum novogranatense]
MDVKTTFLNGNLQEDVYMTQPEGFESKEFPNQVCKLQRSIYSLKQASRSWNIRFDEIIKKFDFIKNMDEPCVYKKVSGSAVYLRRTKDIFLVYGGAELRVQGYSDANFQSDQDDSRSQSGYIFTLYGGAEAIWIKKFILELGVVPSIVEPIILYCDNNGVMQAKNLGLINGPNMYSRSFT